MAKSGKGGGWLGGLAALITAVHLAHEAADDLEWLAGYCVPWRMGGGHWGEPRRGGPLGDEERRAARRQVVCLDVEDRAGADGPAVVGGPAVVRLLVVGEIVGERDGG